MPMDTSSLYFGLLADKQARAERESQRHARAGQQSLMYQQQRQQELDRALEREAKRAEIAAKYSEISGEPIRAEFSSERPVAQGMEAGRLQGAAYDETTKHNQTWDRFALERMRQEGQDRRLEGRLTLQKMLETQKAGLTQQRIAILRRDLARKIGEAQADEALRAAGLIAKEEQGLLGPTERSRAAARAGVKRAAPEVLEEIDALDSIGLDDIFGED